MIVCISKTGVSAFLDYGVIYSRIQDNFSSHRFAGTSTGTGRDIHGGNFRAAFVLERQTDGCFILAYLRIYVKQRGSVHLVKTGGYYLVFYRIGGIGGQSLVHFQDIHVYIHITGRVRRLLLAVYRYALYRSFAAELFPARLLVPGIQGGSGKLVRLPFAERCFKGDDTPPAAPLLRYRGNGGSKSIETFCKWYVTGYVISIPAGRTAAAEILPLFDILKIRVRITSKLFRHPAVGSKERKDYTVFPDIVNLSRRFQCCKYPRQITINAAGAQKVVYIGKGGRQTPVRFL